MITRTMSPTMLRKKVVVIITNQETRTYHSIHKKTAI